MKRHLIIIMNIVLIALVSGAIIFTVINSLNRNAEEAEFTASENIAATIETQPATAVEKAFKIGIIQHGLGNASKDCYEGFITELNERGLLDKIEIVYIVEDNKDLCRDKIQNIADSGCDLLYTIGRYASETAADITKEIPIVFGAVNSPDEVGLVESNEVPGGNVTGVSSYTPCFEQIDLIKILLPDTKNIATLYSATDADAVMQGIIAEKEAENIGASCEKYPIEDEKALTAALEKIKDSKAEVIYIPVDKFLSAHISELKEFSYTNKIPIICGDEATLELGAFATSEINYSSIGRKAAGMANDILFGGKSPATLPVNYKHDCTNIVNKTVMNKLGIKLPATALPQVEMWEDTSEPASETADTTAESEADTASDTAAEVKSE